MINYGGNFVFSGKQELLIFVKQRACQHTLFNFPPLHILSTCGIYILALCHIIGNLVLSLFFKSSRLLNMLPVDKFSQMSYLEHNRTTFVKARCDELY